MQQSRFRARPARLSIAAQQLNPLQNSPDLPIAPSSGIIGRMSKGHAFGFLIVLLVLVLGLYTAFTSFLSTREALRARPTLLPGTRVVQATPVPTGPAPTATSSDILTPTLEATVALTVEVPTAVTEPSSPTEPPAPAPTEPPLVQPTNTSAPVVQPPTPAPIPAYQFRLAGPPAADPNYPNCCYIYGTVRDATGNGIEGMQVQALNEWNTLPPAVTKGYNIPLGHEVVAWDIIVLDAAGNQISTKATVSFDPNVANGYRVDWQRTY